jgi:acetyltransferase-like isoleucine patch superfamily enzyme
VKKLFDRLLVRLAVRANVEVGVGFHVGPGSVIWAPRHLRIGNDVYVGKGVTIQVDGEIGDAVLIANSVGIVGRTDHDIRQVGVPIRRAAWVGDQPESLSRITHVGSDVWIGFGAIVLSGVSIGDSSIVAAGSIVTKDVPKNSIVAGAPAQVRGQRFSDEEFARHWVALAKLGVRESE